MQVDWLNINPLRGGTGQTEIYASVTPNERAGSTRNATVRFTNTVGLTADLNLSQTSNTEDLIFQMTPNHLFVDNTGGTYYVRITTNTFWRITDYDSFITVASDDEEGYGDAILKITFPFNPSTESGRTGTIIANTMAGIFELTWEQPAYNAITVTPDKLVFPQSGGTLPVTVSASSDWEIVSFDAVTTMFSTMSGESGETVVYVTKAPLTQGQIEYYSTAPSTVEFSDGVNVAKLRLDSTLDDYFIDDDWITVTYNVPSANTEVILFANLGGEYITPTVQFQDNEHSEMYRNATRINLVSGDPDSILVQYLTTYTTPGLHTIKMRFNKEGSIIPKYGFAGRLGLSPAGTMCYEKIVIGNRLNGFIEACVARNSEFKEVILGTGDITGVGEFAFLGCGSEDKDFVLGNNVKNLMYEPFHNFTARKFVFNQDKLGGTAYTKESKSAYKDRSSITISGQTYTFSSAYTAAVGGEAYVSEWYGYMGDITCAQFVIGDKVSQITTNPFYPFGPIGERSGLSNTYNAFIYAYAGFSFGKSYPMTGCTVPAIYCLPKTAPVAQTYDFTPTIQEFKKPGQIVGSYDFYKVFRIGPERDIPFHYPVGADYSAYEEYWPNMIGDLDV